MTSGHVFIATSLDGFIARVDGSIDWLESCDTAGENHGYEDFIKDKDGIIMGRGSYEKVLSFGVWPYSKMVVVLSKTLAPEDLPDNLRGKVRFLNLPPRQLMEQLSREGWKKAYVDGGQIIQSFLREKLIHDLIMTRIPVLIGQGRPLFGPLTMDISLTHITSKSFPSGLVQSQYKVHL